jgi:hypothetical protein
LTARLFQCILKYMVAHRHPFRWNAWNREQVRKHGLTERDVEYVVRTAKHPYPRRYKSGWRVAGQTPTYRWIAVMYGIGDDDMIFVYHAM